MRLARIGEYVKDPKQIIVTACAKGALNWLSGEAYLKV